METITNNLSPDVLRKLSVFINESFLLNHTTSNYVYGKFLGYPACCIEAFGDINMTPIRMREDVVQKTVKNGYVPCPSCARKILSGETTREELINSNRLSVVPYKENQSDEEKLVVNKELSIIGGMY